MKIIIAPDSYKGSLSSAEICEIVSKAAGDVTSNFDAVSVPIADGGEGTVDSILFSCGGNRITTSVHDPLGRIIEADYGIVNADSSFAVIETAAASGITLVTDEEREVMRQNSLGIGEQIKDAIERGCKDIYIGLGGSATNDGGIGLASALGAKFYDEAGMGLEPIPVNLEKVASADLSWVAALLDGIHITLMCDVTNPLLGPEGATAIYGPQKGVTPEMVKTLDGAMSIYADALEAAAGKIVRNNPGAGAAGGIGACLMAIADAEVKSGAKTILELADFGRKLDGAMLVVTGEGKMDGQSVYGKATLEVAEAAKSVGVPCVALVGIAGDGAESMYEHGITRIVEIGKGLSAEESIKMAKELCYKAAHDIFEEFYLDYGKFISNSVDCVVQAESGKPRKHVNVVAAIIRDGNRIFTTQRGHGDYKDWWEFPGGKIEPGETPEEALEREIREELNTRIEVGEKLTTINYSYPRHDVTMDCFWCRVIEGSLELLEAESSTWLDAENLFSVNWLPSDTEIIELIKLELEKTEE